MVTALVPPKGRQKPRELGSLCGRNAPKSDALAASGQFLDDVNRFVLVPACIPDITPRQFVQPQDCLFRHRQRGAPRVNEVKGVAGSLRSLPRPGLSVAGWPKTTVPIRAWAISTPSMRFEDTALCAMACSLSTLSFWGDCRANSSCRPWARPMSERYHDTDMGICRRRS